MDHFTLTANLRAIADRIATLLEGLGDTQVRHRPTDSEWSLLELGCHVRDAAEEESARVTLMLAEDNPTLPPYDADQRARERLYNEDDPTTVLAFARTRFDDYAHQLEALTDVEWQRPGVHPTLGPAAIRTRAERVLAHSLEHLAQMEGVRAGLAQQ